ncbi:MAG TPA: farnesyl diphosphate synthase [Thermoanaerobaculia bacterium]|nr:farnesyl diphosphate synthase [Thermoanaerobaculia bacterium]
MTEPISQYLQSRRQLIDRVIEATLPPPETPPAVIHEAMRYAVLGGGKRVRPILAIAAAEACGADVEPLLVHFAALELIHTYSLVHDDLPALENDDLRRGRKTTHVVFGEAMGILAGDALLTEALSWLARPIDGLDPARQLRAVREVAIAVDSKGMIGGQVADLEAERSQERTSDRKVLFDRLEFIHSNKTGRLLTVSVLLGGILGGASETTLELLRVYGRDLGLAFQIVDDLLDLEETAETLGKTAGKDLAQGKLTYPALMGAAAARQKVSELLAATVSSAETIGGSVNYLAPIARYVCERRS